MPKQEAPLHHLQNYLPPGTYDAVAEYLHRYKVHLTVARERKSILGDYRHSTHHVNHRISVNGNLNAYSFLITLLHELAHLLTFEQYKNEADLWIKPGDVPNSAGNLCLHLNGNLQHFFGAVYTVVASVTRCLPGSEGKVSTSRWAGLPRPASRAAAAWIATRASRNA